MNLLVFRALWGMDGTPAEQLARIAAAGYDGVELWPIGDIDWRPLLADSPLKRVVAAGPRHPHEIEPTLHALAAYQPERIVLHSGFDAMSREEGLAFYAEAARVEAGLGIPVGHETHRGRAFFTPWDTAFYLNAFPTLHITADYSHWVNVCERLPDDQADALALANARAVHIHGRVGYGEGPQVPDPSDPAYAGELAWHEAQWTAIRDHHRARGAESLTFTPEYGPPPYTHTLPHTGVPVADLWRICLWAMARARGVLG